MTQTKIIATLGPSSDSAETIRALIEEGVDVCRINFSHGSPDQHRTMARTVRRVAADLNREVALLGDLAGPKIRCGQLATEPLKLEDGEVVRLISGRESDSADVIPIDYLHFHEDVHPHQEIAMDDGRIRMRVESVAGNEVQARVTEGGVLLSRKGVNLPDTELQIGAITDEDRDNLALAAEEQFDLIGLSFVGTAGDVEEARRLLGEWGASPAIIAKIERRSAIRSLDAILDAADGAMVARGDLGVETPIEDVPLLQKEIIRACNLRAKPVITATQMMESMIHNRRPTRAEVTDIANAILDGTDAVMLSGETAVGRYPVDTVRTMDRVAGKAERAINRERQQFWRQASGMDSDSAFGHAASQLVHDLNLDAVVCFTKGGTTARRVARHRPACPIVAASGEPAVVRRLLLTWGVEPVHLSELDDPGPVGEGETTDEPLEKWIDRMLGLCADAGLLRRGRKVVVVAGLPLGKPGITNFVHLGTVPGARNRD